MPALTALTPALDSAVTVRDEPSLEPAAQRVLHTFELLEAILMEVDMKTLLLNQRVNRTWRDLIQASTPLQKKLWYIPDEEQETWHTDGSGKISNFNMLLYDRAHRTAERLRADVSSIPDIVSLRIDWGRDAFYGLPESFTSEDIPPCDIQIVFKQGVHEPGNEPVGSWRKMLLYQPHDRKVRWSASIAGEPHTHIYRSRHGCCRNVWIATKFYKPKRLQTPPTVEDLLSQAIEYRKEWAEGRRRRPIKEQIRDNKFGERHYVFTTGFRRLAVFGVACIIMSPILVPAGILILGSFEIHNVARKCRKSSKAAQSEDAA